MTTAIQVDYPSVPMPEGVPGAPIRWTPYLDGAPYPGVWRCVVCGQAGDPTAPPDRPDAAWVDCDCEEAAKPPGSRLPGGLGGVWSGKAL